jgi:uncharacterized cupredoxin-like copper-binding protein
MTTDDQDRSEEERQVHERLALPLLIPATVFLFAVLVIYGLSRIYLELDTYHIGDVSMATPLGIGVSIVILLGSAFLASQRRIAAFQVAGLFVIGASLLTAGSIWAAVHEEKVPEHANGKPTPVDGTPVPTVEGEVVVDLIDPQFGLTVNPASAAAGDVTFAVTNAGTIIHNLRVIQTDLDPADLPLDSSGFQVDETQVNVVGELAEFPSGQTETLDLTLESGSYVLICNVSTHYEQGMHAAFTVE